jgi:predicted nucleic acid-binding protein
MFDDPTVPPKISSPDPDDDYLIALAERSRSVIVAGDRGLLELSGQIPVYSPTQFLALVEEHS